jgi:hypothetical protein
LPPLSDLVALAAPVATGVALAALVLALVALAAQRRLLRRLLGATAEPDIRAGLASLASGLHPLVTRVTALEAAQAAAAAREPARLLPPGMVRFQAYPNDGPALSFSLALVNARQDGVVLTSLYARDHVRLFAKAIKAGAAEGEMAPEERQAVELAAAGGGQLSVEPPAAAATARAFRPGRGQS